MISTGLPSIQAAPPLRGSFGATTASSFPCSLPQTRLACSQSASQGNSGHAPTIATTPSPPTLTFGRNRKEYLRENGLPERLDTLLYQLMMISAMGLYALLPLPFVRRRMESLMVAGGGSKRVCTLNDAPPELRDKLEVLQFKTRSGNANMNGWFLPPKPGKPTLVISHGRNRNFDEFNDYLKAFAKKGWGVALYDLRSYGLNKGPFSAKAASQDLDGLSHYLAKEKDIPLKQQILMGWSLGGAITAEVAAQHERRGKPYRGVVLMSTFSSLGAVIQLLREEILYKAFNRLLPLDFILQQPFESVEKMQDLKKTPVLILHGKADGICDPLFANQLYYNIPSQNRHRQMLPYDGEHHWIDPSLTIPDIERFFRRW